MKTTRNSVLAIDPGTREMGFAFFHGDELEDYGVKDIRYVAGADDVFEAVQIVTGRLIRQKRPRAMAIEKNNFSQIRQNLRLMLAIAKMKSVAQRYRVRTFEFDPRTIRKVVCKDGNATKRELARIIAARYPETLVYLESNRRWRERYYQNAFDAIACGLTFTSMSRTFSIHGYVRSAGGRK